MSRRDFTIKLYARNSGGTLVEYEYSTTGHYDVSGTDWEDGRLKEAGVLRRDMFSQNRIRGPLAVNDGGVVLENIDGELDTLREMGFDGEGALLYELNPTTLATLYNSSYNKLVSEQPIMGANDVTVALHDLRHLLDRQLVEIRYAGTNSGSPLTGIEGTADDLKGQPKPFVAGRVFNITPRLVNTTRRIYQVHGVGAGAYDKGGIAGALETGWTMTVYDKRAALTAGANYSSLADMLATAPSAGQYRVHPGSGCFRLGSAPTGRITCDVTNPMFGGTYKVSEVANKILGVAAGYLTLEVGATHLTADPSCGIYIDGEINALEALSQVLGSLHATLIWSQPPGNADPLLPVPEISRVIQLTLPADSPYLAMPDFGRLVLTETDIGDTLVPVVPQEADRGLPVWRVRVGYARNYTVMSDADLAGVAAATAEIYKQPYRYAVAEDTTVKTQFPNAGELQVDTLLINPTDAQAEADRLLAMFKSRREMFQLRVPFDAIKAQSTNPRKFSPGWVVNITYPRFGLSAGKDFILLAIVDNLDEGTVDLTVWG